MTHKELTAKRHPSPAIRGIPWHPKELRSPSILLSSSLHHLFPGLGLKLMVYQMVYQPFWDLQWEIDRNSTQLKYVGESWEMARSAMKKHTFSNQNPRIQEPAPSVFDGLAPLQKGRIFFPNLRCTRPRAATTRLTLSAKWGGIQEGSNMATRKSTALHRILAKIPWCQWGGYTSKNQPHRGFHFTLHCAVFGLQIRVQEIILRWLYVWEGWKSQLWAWLLQQGWTFSKSLNHSIQLPLFQPHSLPRMVSVLPSPLLRFWLFMDILRLMDESRSKIPKKPEIVGPCRPCTFWIFLMHLHPTTHS